MDIKQLQGPTDAHLIDIPFVNAQGATITSGLPVAFATGANSNDGIKAVLPATGNALTFAGICVQTTPNNMVGRVRASGYVASIAIYAHGTSVTTGAGVAMGPAAGSLGVSSTGLKDVFGPVVSMEAIGALVHSAGGYAKGFVRAC